MKKLATFLILFVLLTFGAFAQNHSQVLKLKMDSEILGTQRDYAVYLPSGYAESGKAYPVLYLLHGAWDNYQAWANKGNVQQITDEAIDSGMSQEMIIVMPDAKGEGKNLDGKNMGYFNVPGWAYEDYFFNEFIPFIDKTYRTIANKQGRAIAGLSMGGGGATVYAQHHPDVLGSACSLSGLLEKPLDVLDKDANSQFGKSVSQNSAVDFVRNATPKQIEALKSVRWYIDCGDDDVLADRNVNMYLAMKQKNIPLQYRMRDGAHTWLYWSTALPTVLQFCSTGFPK